MGDPKKRRKQYDTPIHPWQKARIDEEKLLMKEYGLKNKKEIWKLASKTRDFARQAKKLIANISPQGELERKQLLTRLASLNILTANSNLDDVLGLSTKNLMDRRLQTMLVKKGIAKSMKESRQFITHGHIMIGSSKITVPSYMVKKDEENSIAFMPTSAILKQRAEEPKAAKAEGVEDK
jgi:small subunit ribosomal protein S4